MREAHSVRRVAVKEVLGADRAGGQVPALVLLELSQVHTAVTLHAVAHIPPQALPQAAQVTEGAVVDVPPGLIVKQLADAAVVACHAGMAGSALSCSSRGAASGLLGHSQGCLQEGGCVSDRCSSKHEVLGVYARAKGRCGVASQASVAGLTQSCIC